MHNKYYNTFISLWLKRIYGRSLSLAFLALHRRRFAAAMPNGRRGVESADVAMVMPDANGNEQSTSHEEKQFASSTALRIDK